MFQNKFSLLNFANILSNCREATNSIQRALKQLSPFLEQLQAYSLYYSKITSQYWPITNPILIKHLSSVTENQIEQTIVYFYSQENYFQIQQMVSDWKDFNFLACRMPIFNSCLNILLSDTSGEDRYNVIIPTLMAQLTGLKESLYDYIPPKEKTNIEKDLRRDLKNPKNKVGDNAILSQFLYEKHLIPGYILLELNEIIFDRAFARKDKVSKLDIEKYNKFRNKILHGDPKFLNYGTEANMIRTWLEIDFLIKVHNEIRQRSNIANTNKK